MPQENNKKRDILGMIPGIGGAIIAGAQMLGIGDKRQIRQQAKLNKLQEESQVRLGEHNRQMQMQMWNDTNYGAQVEHLKNAGMNPALLYGKGGMGGMTVGSGMATGVAGAQAANAAQTSQASAGMGLMGAQIALMNAQTEKTKVEANKLAGVDTEKVGAEIANLTQGIENAKQQQMLTNVQTRLAKLQEIVQGATIEDVIDRVAFETEKAGAELESALNEAYVSTATRQEKITIFQQEAIAGMLNNALTKMKTSEAGSNIEVNNAKIKQMAEQIAQGWAGLEISDRQTAIQKFKEEVTANYPNLMNTVGKLIDDGISTIFEIGGRFRRQFKSVRP